MIFPIGDEQVKGGFKPIFSYSFIVLNIIIFLFQLSVNGNLICALSVIPHNIINGQSLYTLITSLFLHGSWMHLLGNMLFLWIFADNIEATIGNFKFLLFYILGGLAASAIHIYFNQGGLEMGFCCFPCDAINPCSMQNGSNIPCPSYIPSLGASGSISAVMGAYLVMYPKSKINILVLIFFRTFKIPAFIFLGIWFAQQLFFGIGNLGPSAQTTGVAWWAHIGGFAFGLLGGWIFRTNFINKKPDNSMY